MQEDEDLPLAERMRMMSVSNSSDKSSSGDDFAPTEARTKRGSKPKKATAAKAQATQPPKPPPQPRKRKLSKTTKAGASAGAAGGGGGADVVAVTAAGARRMKVKDLKGALRSRGTVWTSDGGCNACDACRDT